MFQERRQQAASEKLRSARLVYTNALNLWRYTITARIVLLATTSTAVGVLVNALRTGVSTVQTVQRKDGGLEIVRTTGAVSIGFAVGIAVVLVVGYFTVLAADRLLGRITNDCLDQGLSVESQLQEASLFAHLSARKRSISRLFVAGRTFLFIVFCFWATALLLQTKGVGEWLFRTIS